MLELNTSYWQAEIAPEAGANLCRLLHKPTGLDVLRYPDCIEQLQALPDCFGMPFLFPPNRIDGGRFTWQGREYVLPINEPDRGNNLHGAILGKPWEVVEASQEHVVMSHHIIASIGFMHDCTLTLRYCLQGNRVQQKISITNHSDLAMPIGVGFHTAFKMSADTKIHLGLGNGYWEMSKLRFLPTGKCLPWPDGYDGIYDEREAVSCHLPIPPEQHKGLENSGGTFGGNSGGAVIEYPLCEARLHYEVDANYRHWCLWNDGGGKGFFCVEPMTWMTNSPNLDLPDEVTGLQSVEPHQTWHARTQIVMIN